MVVMLSPRRPVRPANGQGGRWDRRAPRVRIPFVAEVAKVGELGVEQPRFRFITDTRGGSAFLLAGASFWLVGAVVTLVWPGVGVQWVLYAGLSVPILGVAIGRDQRAVSSSRLCCAKGVVDQIAPLPVRSVPDYVGRNATELDGQPVTGGARGRPVNDLGSDDVNPVCRISAEIGRSSAGALRIVDQHHVPALARPDGYLRPPEPPTDELRYVDRIVPIGDLHFLTLVGA